MHDPNQGLIEAALRLPEPLRADLAAVLLDSIGPEIEGETDFEISTEELRRRLAEAREMIASGFRAVLCCVDTSVLPAEFAGRRFDEALLADLPATVDPCGENGEFHTFVYDGPNFRSPIPWTLGERVLREQRFAYVDLVPNTDA